MDRITNYELRIKCVIIKHDFKPNIGTANIYSFYRGNSRGIFQLQI